MGAKVIEDCQFTANYCWGPGGGGAAYLYNCTVTGCTFTENDAESRAGALVLGGSNTVLRCTFRNNSNGAVYVRGGSSEMTGCVFTGNRASRGGALFADVKELALRNCVFSGNRATDIGGAAYGDVTSRTVSSCTFFGNRASTGGAIAIYGKNAIIRNSIFWGNQAGEASSNSLYGALAAITMSYSLLQGDEAGVSQGSTNQPLWGPGNIEVDPCFAVAGHWDPNGTPSDANDDYFVEGDYHLKSQAGRWDPSSDGWAMDDVTSPCIDAGDPNSPVGDEPQPNGARINMGAYGGTTEASKSSGEPAGNP